MPRTHTRHERLLGQCVLEPISQPAHVPLLKIGDGVQIRSRCALDRAQETSRRRVRARTPTYVAGAQGRKDGPSSAVSGQMGGGGLLEGSLWKDLGHSGPEKARTARRLRFRLWFRLAGSQADMVVL